MKKLIALLTVAACAVAFTATAADKGKAGEVRKELLEKYDANKDGKIDKDEAAKMTPEDKSHWDRLSGGKKKKKSE